ncbi:MAG: ATP-binding protein, partial [Bacteroidota bacterium]
MQAQTIIVPEEITIEDGLSQGYITFMHQDIEGFLWIGTKNGLNRYDGRQFEVFTHDPDDPYSIANDWIYYILEEGDFLLIGTRSPQLNIYHKKTKKFYKLPIKLEGIEDFDVIGHIFKNSTGQFFITTHYSPQLLSVRFPENFWTSFPKQDSLLKQVETKLVEKEAGYASTIDGDNIVITEQEAFKKLDTRTLERTNLKSNLPYDQLLTFRVILPNVGIGSVNELQPYPRQLYQLEKGGGWEKMNSTLRFDWISYFDSLSNLVWLQNAQKDQLLAFDKEALKSTEQFTDEDAYYVINDNDASVISYYKDRSGTLWMGTSGLGLKKLSPRKLAIKTYLQDESIQGRIFSAGEAELFYRNVFGEVFYQSGEEGNLAAMKQLIASVNPQNIYWLNEEENAGWLCMVKPTSDANYKDFILYQKQNGDLIKKADFPIQCDWVIGELSLTRGVDQKLYALHSNNLIQFDSTIQQHIVHRIDVLQKKNPIIFYLAQTANGNIWIGTSQGLIQAQPNAKGFDFQLVNGLRNQVCASLLVDPNDANILWIGTKGGGLHRLDTRNMQFEYVNTKNGLPNDVIYAVLNDEQGNLWLSSNKGIINYHPKTGMIRNFTANDGLQSDEFNTYSFGKSPTGELFFGGIKGLNVFHPDDLKDNPVVPNVQLTSLEVNNQLISALDSSSILTEEIEYTESITLAYTQNNFTLSFAALEFTAPFKNSFNYYLEGAEPEWIHTTTDNEATYLNLNPGKYTFKLKAANGDGVWNETIKSLNITVLPPWYRSKLAYLIYMLLAGFGIWLFLRFQKKRLELSHAVELEQQKSERLKELDEAKSRIYTNITHEFRTPLTVISGLIDQVDDQHDFKTPIQRNSSQLLNLVNQMLDLRKLETGNLTVHYVQADIIRYLRYLTSSFQSYAESKQIGLHFLTEKAQFVMDFDQEKIARIFYNLLSNAIKFTNEGGNIYIRTAIQPTQFQLEIKDTGRGIPEKELPYIFEQFYQVDNSSTRRGEGTGIGLTLVKELVNILKGTIQVESRIGEGTTFRMTLPITNNARLEHDVPSDQSDNGKMVVTTPISTEPSNIESTAADLSKPTVLLVEDNADVLHYLISCLKDQYEIEIAMNGAEGIQKAIENTPDIIVSDVMMPEKNGFELCETLKADVRSSHIPIILLTAKVDLNARLEGLGKGANAYLSKPFHQEELLLILQNQLQIRQQLQARFGQVITNGQVTTDNATELDVAIEDAFLKNIRSLVEMDL